MAVRRLLHGTAAAPQATASLYTLAATALVARELDVVDFGRFAVVQLVLMFAVGVQRAGLLIPVMIRPGAGERPPQAGVRTRVLLQSLAAAAVTAAVGVVVGGGARDICLALAVAVVPVLYWDTVRAHLQGTRGYPALTRGELTCLVTGVLWFAAVPLLARDVLVVAAGLAVAPAVAALTVLPPWSARWQTGPERHGSRAGRHLLLDYLVYTGLDQVVLVVAGAFLTVVATGALRLGQTALGPVTVLLLACETTAVPRLRDLSGGRSHRLRVAAPVFTGVALAALACGVALALLPADWGTALLGPTWTAAGGVVAALAVRQAVSALAAVPTLALLTSGATRTIIRCRVLTAPLVAGGSLLALAGGDVVTFAWSFACLHLVASGALWVAALRPGASQEAR
ncbi:hypothetical protein [Pseudonocardia alni]|uniref:hypothetical protein n=1 Tax=Pseudonocardia alni TaxID=33907 RepID=UPI001AD79EA6|nr:hypothetical protein [Pseudonocardia alni]MBO4237348.1 hypothetical protein [Pseudonocardia alni]